MAAVPDVPGDATALAEQRLFEESVNRVRWGAVAVLVGLGPFFPNLWPPGVFALGMGVGGYNLLLVRGASRAATVASLRHVAVWAFRLDLVAVCLAMLLFATDPVWTTFIIAPLVITGSAFRLGTEGAFAATIAIAADYLCVSVFRWAAFDYPLVPVRILFHLSVFVLTAVLADRLLHAASLNRLAREGHVARLERTVREHAMTNALLRALAGASGQGGVLSGIVGASRPFLQIDRAALFAPAGVEPLETVPPDDARWSRDVPTDRLARARSGQDLVDAPGPTLLAPVRSGEHLIGILALARDVREFDADERDAALAVAATVAEALERERLTAAVAETAALRATERMRSEFFDTVSHELRTPLTAISAALELVEHRDGAQKGSPVDHARRNAERLRRTVDDLLDMARLRGKGIALNVRPVGCREVLEDVAAAHAPLAAQHDQRFSVRCDALDVDVDRARLAQALGNLVANALKYTPRGTLVELAAESAAGEVRFSVTDHGTGIPLAARPRLFERFYRVGRDSALTGSGLGLSIAKALVELHGGRIWLEDPPEGGTRFVIALPVAASRAAVAAGVAN